MYDSYKFIVNQSKSTEESRDVGDSCFFMGLQALNYCMRKEFVKAKNLYLLCKKIDFYRHPTFYKKDTSIDMMLPFDFIATKWPNYGIERPPFHTRVSKHFDGAHRAPWMFEPLTLLSEFSLRDKSPALGEDYYKNHLLILKAGTALNIKNNIALRKAAEKHVKKLEGLTTVNGKVISNLFFNWVLDLPNTFESSHLWFEYWYLLGNKINGYVEWEFQRDPRLRLMYGERYKDTEFHQEDGHTLGMQFFNNLK